LKTKWSEFQMVYFKWSMLWPPLATEGMELWIVRSNPAMVLALKKESKIMFIFMYMYM
jgi:hypothetical protein